MSNSPNQVISNEALFGHTVLNIGFNVFFYSDYEPPPPLKKKNIIQITGQFYNVDSFLISVMYFSTSECILPKEEYLVASR